jgi:hypothetical protein
MSIYRLVGAAAAFALITITASAMTPARAQQVISEPGYCAFFYPNANCQNKGPGNPYTDPRRFAQGDLRPEGTQAAGVVKKRARTSATRMQ